ncbi:MAG: AhpC/TSA family protein, partial [Actinobacteria bacterium]|nr:AhpC/TSA family protein [Actinomycetota bacterium]
SQTALGIDVAGGNADGTATVPMPTVVVVDAGGTIRWIDVHPNYGTRSEPTEILEAVVALTK